VFVSAHKLLPCRRTWWLERRQRLHNRGASLIRRGRTPSCERSWINLSDKYKDGAPTRVHESRLPQAQRQIQRSGKCSVEAWQREKVEVEKSCEVRVAKIGGEFQRFSVHFRRTLRYLRYDLEGVLGRLGALNG
jgi:hypothetical protein